MERKKVSIIVPVYNTEKYIDRCIQSILSQNYSDIELILINDGSTDSSGTICEKYSKEYKNVIYKYQENSGVSVARNTGIELATGEYVAFVDSDDAVKSNMISSLVDALESSEADLSICGYDIARIDEVIPVPIPQETVFGKENIAAYFSEHFTEAIASSVFAKLYKKSLFSYGFNPEFSMGEDLLFNLEYVKKITKLVIVPETLYIYNKTNEGSLTRTYKKVYHEQNLYVFKRWLDWFCEFDNVDDSKVHCRIVRSYMHELFNVCAGKIPGKKIQLVKSILDDDLFFSIKRSISCFDMSHRMMLRLILRERYRMFLCIGIVYCEFKN